MKFRLILILLLTTLQVKAQKLGNYFQYSTFNTTPYINSRIQPINENQYFWILDNNGISSPQNIKVDSLVLINFLDNYRKNLTYPNFNSHDLAVLWMNKKTPNWIVNFSTTPINAKTGSIMAVNTLTAGNDLILYCKVTGDSIKAHSESGQISAINIPDTAGYAVIKINQKAEVSLENFFVTGSTNNITKLLWANDQKYSVYFFTSTPPRAQLPFYKRIPTQNLLPDSQTTAIILQYKFGSTAVINSMTGTFPVVFNPLTSNRSFINNKVLIAGTYESVFGNRFPYNHVYKTNTGSTIPLKKPINFSKKRNYLFWININMENWTLDEVEYLNTSDSINSYFLDCGQLKNAYWFQSMNLDSIALNQNTLKWQKSNGYSKSLFTYDPNTKTLNTMGFPDGIIDVYADGDSLLMVGGDNTKASNNLMVDMDKSPYFHYPIKKGKYIAQFTPTGKLLWGRDEDVTTNSEGSIRFISHNGGRYLSIFNEIRNDLDLGFKKAIKFPLNSISGTVTQLSKAPICDFDIELITYNHVTINYKGALNANFYFKYGDGSKDSNYNQRYFIHSYKKTGTFLLYCIAKNDFGRDTAYYEIDIYDIVSTTKLNKNNDIKLFPNPTENTLSWEAESTTHVDIFDANAKFIERIQTTQNSINITHLPAGLYMVSVHTKNGSFINKIIKQ